ncbi:MAG TPA: efflux RND transporter periplasmic adaptor subunit [Pelomicrobium sp.]|nr:efflux RND transporter periplasmic adaptor subunit [Pelomicrobium sp.]
MSSEELDKLRIDRAAPRRRRRILPWLIVAAVVAGGAVLLALSRSATEVQTATVVQVYPSHKYTLLNATGYVVPQRKASVASKATGRLEWLGVAEGSRVQAGQLIARLENNDVVATRDQAAANVRVARSSLAQAEAELADAERELARARELAAQRFISQATVDQAQARHDKAKAAVVGARAAIGAAEANLRAAEIAVEYTLIRAPFDGVVLQKFANIGDIVSPFNPSPESKGAVVSMADMDTLEVEADVSESNLSKVKVEQPCEIALDARPDTRFAGIVRRIVPTVDRSKATVLVKVGFLDRDDRVLPDMSARVAFLSQPVPAAERSPRTAVAAGAVVERSGRRVVFRVADGRAVAAPVTTGERIGDVVVVEDGLEPGETVVKAPPPELNDGDRVKVAAK